MFFSDNTPRARPCDTDVKKIQQTFHFRFHKDTFFDFKPTALLMFE